MVVSSATFHSRKISIPLALAMNNISNVIHTISSLWQLKEAIARDKVRAMEFSLLGMTEMHHMGIAYIYTEKVVLFLVRKRDMEYPNKMIEKYKQKRERKERWYQIS